MNEHECIQKDAIKALFSKTESNASKIGHSGAWRLAFWIMTGVCFFGLVLLGKEVIANDRMRVSDKESLATSMSAMAADIREIKTVLKLKIPYDDPMQPL